MMQRNYDARLAVGSISAGRTLGILNPPSVIMTIYGSLTGTSIGKLFIPLVGQLGFDPIWFGILFTLNMELGYITPPFGFNLFYMKSLAGPQGIDTKTIYRSVTPFVFLEIIGLVIIMLFPEIALWLFGIMMSCEMHDNG